MLEGTYVDFKIYETQEREKNFCPSQEWGADYLIIVKES